MGENVLVIIEKCRDESTWQDQQLHSPALHLSKAIRSALGSVEDRWRVEDY